MERIGYFNVQIKYSCFYDALSNVSSYPVFGIWYLDIHASNNRYIQIISQQI